MSLNVDLQRRAHLNLQPEEKEHSCIYSICMYVALYVCHLSSLNLGCSKLIALV
jgi:hypothetical protein